MNTKLTPTIEKAVIEKAKEYAAARGRSLSDLIENYLKIITVEQQDADSNLTPIVKSLKGSFKPPRDIDYKKELSQSLTNKYL